MININTIPDSVLECITRNLRSTHGDIGSEILLMVESLTPEQAFAMYLAENNVVFSVNDILMAIDSLRNMQDVEELISYNWELEEADYNEMHENSTVEDAAKDKDHVFCNLARLHINFNNHQHDSGAVDIKAFLAGA